MRSSRTPWLTISLAAINIFAAFLLYLRFPDWLDTGGFRADHPTLLTLFTNLFLHANTVHLMGNMIALVAIGAWVEEALGTLKFLIIYFAGGLVGVLIHWLVLRQTMAPDPLVGASGCVAACAAYTGVRYMWSKVVLGPKIRIPVLAMVGIWAGLQILGAFVKLGDASGVSFWAHLGGILAGLILAAALGAPKDASLHLGRKKISEMEGRSPAAVIAASKAHLLHHPTDLDAFEELIEAYATQDQPQEEIAAHLRVLDFAPESQWLVHIERLAELRGLTRIPSLKRCQMAQKMATTSPKAQEILLESVTNEPTNDPQVPEALLALAVLNTDSDSSRSSQLLERLQTEFPLHPATDIAKVRGLLK